MGTAMTNKSTFNTSDLEVFGTGMFPTVDRSLLISAMMTWDKNFSSACTPDQRSEARVPQLEQLLWMSQNNISRSSQNTSDELLHMINMMRNRNNYLDALQANLIAKSQLSSALSLQQAMTGRRDSELAALFSTEQQRLRPRPLDLALQQTQENIPPMPEKRRGREPTFPKKLYQMLLDLQREPGGTDIAAFLPDGRTFVIRKPYEFETIVMPKYFSMGSLASFQRQLNLYDFQRITRGPYKGAYYHNRFIYGQPMLCETIRRSRKKGSKVGKPPPDDKN